MATLQAWSLHRGATVLVAIGFVSLVLGVAAIKIYHDYESQSLRLDEAGAKISSLINRMVLEETDSLTHERWHGSMEALAGLGSTAVPRLIETIEEARNIAASHNSANGSPSSDLFIDAQASVIRTRAVMVLGRIGDARALPILFSLRLKQELCPLRCEIDEAIKQITARHRPIS